MPGILCIYLLLVYLFFWFRSFVWLGLGGGWLLHFSWHPSMIILSLFFHCMTHSHLSLSILSVFLHIPQQYLSVRTKDLNRILDNKENNTNGTISRHKDPKKTLYVYVVVMCSLVYHLNTSQQQSCMHLLWSSRELSMLTLYYFFRFFLNSASGKKR